MSMQKFADTLSAVLRTFPTTLDHDQAEKFHVLQLVRDAAMNAVVPPPLHLTIATGAALDELAEISRLPRRPHGMTDADFRAMLSIKQMETRAIIPPPPSPTWGDIAEKELQIEELQKKIREIKGYVRKCAATISTDPPQDCDAPFCGCNVEWGAALQMAQESGWLDSREADKLRAELADAIKCNGAQAEIVNQHAQLILTLKAEVAFWRTHESGARSMYNGLVEQLKAWKRPALTEPPVPPGDGA